MHASCSINRRLRRAVICIAFCEPRRDSNHARQAWRPMAVAWYRRFLDDYIRHQKHRNLSLTGFNSHFAVHHRRRLLSSHCRAPPTLSVHGSLLTTWLLPALHSRGCMWLHRRMVNAVNFTTHHGAYLCHARRRTRFLCYAMLFKSRGLSLYARQSSGAMIGSCSADANPCSLPWAIRRLAVSLNGTDVR